MPGEQLTVEEERRARMAALYHRTHGPNCADKFRAIAEWWRLHAEESRIPDECRRYADNQDRIADDMERAEIIAGATALRALASGESR